MPLVTNKISINVHRKKVCPKGFHITNLQGAPESTLKAASLTIEAALVFPLFLFILVGMLFFFRVLETELMTQGALEAAGSRISLEAEASEEPFARAAGYFHYALMEKEFSYQHILGGKAGIRWTDTEFSEEYVDLWIHYDCRMPVPVPGIKTIPIVQRVRIKKWTGYHPETGEGAEDEWVYVTPNGSVYHLTKECTHLRLSIHRMSDIAAVQAGYKPCEICGRSQGGAYYYVTDEGQKYHTKLSCSGLKRTIYMIRRSQVGGRGACSRCGGG